MEEIKVANVKCDGCAATIRDGLASLPGVKEISVDVPTGTVRIIGEGVDRGGVEDKLRELGYPPHTP